MPARGVAVGAGDEDVGAAPASLATDWVPLDARADSSFSPYGADGQCGPSPQVSL